MSVGPFPRKCQNRVQHDEHSITGHFAGGLTPEQMLEGVRDGCDMIRQRFDLYEESVLN